MSLNKKELYKLFIKSNLHRLSEETLGRIVEDIEGEVEIHIENELNEEDSISKINKTKTLKPSPTVSHGIKSPPSTPRPPKPSSQY